MQEKLKRKTKAVDKSKEVIATAQDIKYARFLAGNDKSVRDKAVKSLKKWFEQRGNSSIPFSEGDLLLVWKGLFYSMWMSDKPLIQEECAERIASLIHSLPSQTCLLFFKCALQTLANEWFGIDQWRYDKFLLFVRRLLRQALIVLKNNAWELRLIKAFQSTLEETLLTLAASDKKPPLSLQMHLCDIYMEEVAKVSEGKLNPNLVGEFIAPFVKCLAGATDPRVMHAIAEKVVRYLLKQSDLAMEYEEKFHVWKKLGFPGGNINSLQKAASDDDEEIDDEEENEDEEDSGVDEEQVDDDEGALDPRAGRVNVVLPQVNFSAKNIQKLLEEYRFKAANTKARGMIRKLIKEFEELSSGVYPLGIQKVDLFKKEDNLTGIKQSANRLIKFENKLYSRDKVNNKGKKRKNEDSEEVADEITAEVVEKVPKKKQKSASYEKQLAKMVKSVKAEQKTFKSLEKQQRAEALRRKALLCRKLKAQTRANRDGKSNDSFVRNSGVWHVSEPETESDYELEQSPLKTKPTDGASSLRKTPATPVTLIVNKLVNNSSLSPSLTSTPLKSAPCEWDALQNGEVEFFVPSKKYLAKRKSLPLTAPAPSPIRGKNKNRRKSTSVHSNSSAFNGSSLGNKKVKIDLRLNQSQEVHEHHAQIRSSPGIPYDADRKPVRPVIKANAVASPINPFYRRKIRVDF